MKITHDSPSVETERELNRAASLLEDLRSKLPEIWMREEADQVLTALDRTRMHFRDYMMDVSDELRANAAAQHEALVRSTKLKPSESSTERHW